MRRLVLPFSLFVSLMFTGCSGNSSTNNSGGSGGSTGGQETVGLSPTSVTFSSQAVGTTSAATTITLTNTGTAALTLTSFSVDSADAGTFPLASGGTCTASDRIAAGGSCTVLVTFKPIGALNYSGTLTFNDNASNGQQTVDLSGAGTANTPIATFSKTSITFPTTNVGSTAASMSTTLTNTGGGSLTVSSATLSGTNSSAFTITNGCTSSLATSATCTISATFTPSAVLNYSANIVVTDNAASSPTSIALSGLGASTSSGGSVTRTLLTFPATFPESLPDANVTQLESLVAAAKSTIDLTMYELEDTTFSGDLVTACSNGVKVRVILSQSEQSNNTPAYKQLNGAGTNCSAVFSNSAFVNTHQKTMTLDGTTTVIMTLNLQSQYYTTTRDFALIENDAADIAAIEATFNEDYAAGTPSGGTQGPSDFSYTPGGGDTTLTYTPPGGTAITPYTSGDLIWSPTTAYADMLGLIQGAKKTIELENEEMDDANITSALETACTNGVVVKITMTNDANEYGTAFTALEAAGCGVHVYPYNNTALYIHAKAVVADYGLSTQSVYVGSINYSNASMNENRELGIYVTDPTVTAQIESTLLSDYGGTSAY